MELAEETSQKTSSQVNVSALAAAIIENYVAAVEGGAGQE
jgi:hypothetical protein